MPKEKLALECAFTDGNFLYGADFEKIFQDNDIKEVIHNKFLSLSNKCFYFHENELDKFLYGQQENPFDELPTSTEIYNKKIYAITDSGLLCCEAHRYNRKYPVNRVSYKLWDCKLLSLRANKYGKIALSGGNEGLFEYNASRSDFLLFNSKIEKDILQISKDHSLFADWAFLSIYSSSNISNSFMAIFVWEETEKKPNGKSGKEYNRKLEEIVKDINIFGSNGSHKLSWASGDKIYRAVDRGIEVVRFNNYIKDIHDEMERFSKVKRVRFQKWKGDVIFGGTAYYGTIIECENALVVALSDGTFYTIPGPITKWRVYPRSINYENHLHVILEDRIEVYSFNNDYFIDQNVKDFGMKFITSKRRFRT
ncbi:MAG: hypothetical protein ABIB41_05005 [Nitrospirota bacterium]